MRKQVKFISSRFISEQAGEALILILIFLLLGSLTILPTLAHMSTALKTGVTYENKSNELFTADAGIENGLWRIKYDSLGPNYDIYDFSSNWTYQTDPVNNRAAGVTIQNVWIPTNASLAGLGISPDQAKTMVDSDKLVVTGTSGAIPGQPYHIKMEFHPASGDNLTIKSIGIWLPQGFTYNQGSSTLETGGPFTDYYPDSISVSNVPGGQAVVWSYNPSYPPLTSFPNYVSDNGTETSTITFTYAPPADNPNQLPIAIAWVTTAGVSDVPIAWDTDTRIYQITSATGNTQIETYSSKSQLRKLGDAIAGDYVAIGNSLMIGNVEKRDQLLSSSSCNVSAVNPIPADADVLQATLYWTGFRLAGSIFSDTCDNYINWDRGNQTRVPTSDNSSSGTWSRYPTSPATNWDKVDETTPVDTDYVSGNNSGAGSLLFNFSPFTVPVGSTINDVTVYFRAKDYSSGTNNIQAYIKANGSTSTGGSTDPGSAWTTYAAVFATNPKTPGVAWTLADVNGTGTNPLQCFGIYSSDLSPAVSVSMVYAEVNYNRWTVSSGQFRGTGSANMTTSIRTLTLTNSIDLSSYAPGTVALYWDQSTGGSPGSTDALYYAVSGDGGNTWSADTEAFHGSPSTSFGAIVPTVNMTSNFKFRFYFNYTSTSKSVYLDNIQVLTVPPDTDVTFLINNQQVYLDGSGNPQAGSQKLTASSSAVLVNTSTAAIDSGKYGYFYTCHRDVSKLVKKYPVVAGEQHHTGNAQYTVGNVTADTGQYISYAGWSLVIIYTSPETAGHYLYLNDIFAYNPGNTNLDFDGDGQPGGDVTGFVIPEPIRDKNGVITETVAAKVTCFVGEGDAIYTGDSLKITGQQSAHSEYLSNSASPQDNVWNGADTVSSYPGIDIDTFSVLWSQNILMPGDTRLHLDLTTQTDVWELIYIILSVRSETVTSGAQNYTIELNP